MENYVKLDGRRFKNNTISIDDNHIYVNHKFELDQIKRVDYSNMKKRKASHNEIVSCMLEINDGYCPRYLKRVIDNLQVKDDDVKIVQSFMDNLTFDYLNVYKEFEISKILINFGGKIYKIIDKFCMSKKFLSYLGNESINKSFNDECNNSIKEVNKILKNNLSKTESYINELIHKIGVPILCYKNKKNEIESKWEFFIYCCMISYICSDCSNLQISIYESNFIKLIDQYNAFYKKENKNIKGFNLCKKIIKFETDSKEVVNVDNIIRMLSIYIINHCGYYKDYYDSWIADNMRDELDDYKNYLLRTEKNPQKKNLIFNYTYSELDKKIRRKKLNY